MKAFGFIGYSNSGKTTLIERVIPLFRERRFAVSAIKNAHHGFDMDRPGKDSFRYRQAGAGQVLIATGLRWALLTETSERPSTLDELLAQLAPCDLVIIEGFKSEGHMPRIEVRRRGVQEPPLYPHDSNVIAIASDHEVDAPLPVLDINAPAKIADFMAAHLGLARC
jgi:molybdopterin-guanine dinucleotide biosynthesis protein B